MRLVAPYSYVWAFAGQCVVAAGQPLVLNAITKTAARNFPPAQRTAAVSVGSVALFVGVLAAVLSGGPLWDAGGLTLVVWTQAGLSLVAAAWVLVTARVPLAFAADVSVAPTLDWLESAGVRGDHVREQHSIRCLRAVRRGIFLLAALPVVLDWSELHAGEQRAGAAVGFLLLAGNLGGVVLVLVVHVLIDSPYASLPTRSGFALAGVTLATRLPARTEQAARAGRSAARDVGATREDR